MEESKVQNDPSALDIRLRPQSLTEYVGQDAVKRNLRILMAAAKERGEPIEHTLFYGPAGLGKTTLAHIIVHEMQAQIRSTSGPAIERVGDLCSILTNLEDGDILFIDEIHRLHHAVEEVLYGAMEDRKVDIVVGKGPSARTLQLDVPRFTLLGATTRFGALTSPLRSRFGMIHRLGFYTQENIEAILKRSSKLLGVAISDDGVNEIAKRSRFTPRIANRLLKRVRDVAQIDNNAVITKTVAQKALRMLDIDDRGLEPTDRLILTTLIEKFSGGPVGIQTLATATAEEVQTIEDVYEPYLIQCGFLTRTARGRMVTNHARTHLGHAQSPSNKTPLFS